MEVNTGSDAGDSTAERLTPAATGSGTYLSVSVSRSPGLASQSEVSNAFHQQVTPELLSTLATEQGQSCGRVLETVPSLWALTEGKNSEGKRAGVRHALTP